jgi:hypothetical protein
MRQFDIGERLAALLSVWTLLAVIIYVVEKIT